jgi:2-oxoglutarate ferredoxin oxidoreductase subunit alpha
MTEKVSKTTIPPEQVRDSSKRVEELDVVTIRFAGDSGDGMQMTGDRFAMVSATMGEDVITLSDYPAEIRAPAGTVGGVSGFQLHFGSQELYTVGDKADVLVVMNPAALKASLHMLRRNGIIIVNEDAFTERNLSKANYDENPLENDSLKGYQVFKIKITKLTSGALQDSGLRPAEIDRCKNFFALGLTYWLFSRPLESTIEWISKKFTKHPELAQANIKALKAGWNFGTVTEQFTHVYAVRKRTSAKKPGTYRYISGNASMALGLVTAAHRAGLHLFLGSYPITPATEVLQELSKLRNQNVTTYQAEDEIAGIGSAIGAAYAGCLGVTSTSGPGLALKSEFIGMAVMMELPLIIVDVQRAGPSTGMPTKTEQSDLLQAIYGRNGDSPMVVLAARSPKDGFDVAIEAARIALRYMTPVLVLSDGYLANGTEDWRVPKISELPDLKTNLTKNPEGFEPYKRDPETLARPWVIPGTPNMEHRIGSLEKWDVTGIVTYDPANHQRMSELRQAKIEKVAQDYPPTEVIGKKDAELLVLGWGSSYGPIRQAVQDAEEQGLSVACVHLRYLNPLPNDLGAVLKKFKHVLIPEGNMGQLQMLIQAKYTVTTIGMHKVMGLPFAVSEIADKIREILGRQA